jgi:sulfopyruvate decarboxylase subunit beta
MMKRHEALQVLAQHVSDEIVVAIYSTAFDWMATRDHKLNFVSVGAMGLGGAHALGLALGRPDKRVLLFDGDGSLLMSLNSLVTIAEVAPKNFVHFVFENGTYEANGGHPVPGRNRVNFAGMAREAGYRAAYEFHDLADFEAKSGGLIKAEGPVFITLKVEHSRPVKYDYEHLHSTKMRDGFKAALMGA